MAKPDVDDGLLAQHKLMVAVNLSEWATRLDTKVATVVIEKYMRVHKNARVSLRYLEQATGATRPNIIASVRHLCAQGALAVLREGRGTRPTEYRLNFDYPIKSASGIVGDTSTSGIVHDTSCGIAGDTSSACSGIVSDTQTYLPSLPTGRRTGSRNPEGEGTHAPASGDGAAVADAPLPAPPPGARDPKKTESGFEQLWAAWGNKRDKHKAKAAYTNLKPAPELHERLVAQATAWTEAYARNGTEKRFQTSLGNWLDRERYDEDLPEAYVDAKDAAVSRSRANGKTKVSNPGARETGDAGHNLPKGTNRFTVSAVEHVGSVFDAWAVKLTLTATTGQEFEHTFWPINNHDAGLMEEGQRINGALCRAVNNNFSTDFKDCIGRSVVATVGKGGRVDYTASGEKFDFPPDGEPAQPAGGHTSRRAEHDLPRGRRKLTIASIDEPDDGMVELDLTDWDGTTYTHEFFVEHSDPAEALHGRDILDRILAATNNGQRPDNLGALIGRTLEVIVADGEARYLAAS
ncbi:hypothetical protein C5L14_16665 [Labrys okinawensis]|uniref:Helix-turn-helix domain-containing protein n=1 Tax=Labrys okinawensis TaxID=346911 RepID=A0A2S9QC52_9HYPH|nr:hypothetical protein [Labrys okinawensis]PRH86918.1 hypothetical protein C5L14_16665 [Labrys okinawensis]